VLSSRVISRVWGSIAISGGNSVFVFAENSLPLSFQQAVKGCLQILKKGPSLFVQVYIFHVL
jgi:hypothetical protein